MCLCVCVGEAHRIAGRSQCPSDERPDPAEGTLQHADTQRDLAHQPHQAADHRERRVQEQQQLLDVASRESSRVPASVQLNHREDVVSVHAETPVCLFNGRQRGVRVFLKADSTFRGHFHFFCFIVLFCFRRKDIAVSSRSEEAGRDCSSMMDRSPRKQDHQTAFRIRVTARGGGGGWSLYIHKLKSCPTSVQHFAASGCVQLLGQTTI